MTPLTNLVAVNAAIEAGRTIHLAEYPEDADDLIKLGAVACSVEHEDGWPDDVDLTPLTGATVTVYCRTVEGNDWAAAAGRTLEKLGVMTHFAHSDNPLYFHAAKGHALDVLDRIPRPKPSKAEDVPAPADGDQQWRDERPVDPRRRVTVPFPTDALPDVYAGMVSALAASMQVDPAMAGTAVLGALATACTGSATVEVTGSWWEPVCLFLATVAEPGERKSAVHRAVTRPLLVVETELVDWARPGYLEAKAAKDIAEKSAVRARQAAAKGDAGSSRSEKSTPGDSAASIWDDKAVKASADPAATDAIRLTMEAENLPTPVLPRMFSDDVTPERLATHLTEQGGRFSVLSAEGGIFDIMAGRYTNGQANIDIYLKGHAGDAHRTDRVGRESEQIDRTTLTVSLMIQPGVLDKLGQDDTFRSRGLLARFLFALPRSTVGSRLGVAPELPSGVTDKYAAALSGLVKRMREHARTLTLSDGASAVMQEFRDSVERRLGPGEELSHLADWGSKLAGAAVRIAALLHLAAETPGDAITAPTMHAAVDLAEYYQDAALVVFGRMGRDPVVNLAERVLNGLQSAGVTEIPVRDLYRRWLQKVPHKDVISVVTLLTELGWLRTAPPKAQSGPGRKASPVYLVHPALGD